jgi:hypothetical protein
MPNGCEAERAAVRALDKKQRDAHKRYENAPEQKIRELAESQIKHMEELIAKYKDTRGYKKRIKEWTAEKRKNEKKLNKAIDSMNALARARDDISKEQEAANEALERCLEEERNRTEERPHINTGALCWCGERGMHAAGTPR